VHQRLGRRQGGSDRASAALPAVSWYALRDRSVVGRRGPGVHRHTAGKGAVQRHGPPGGKYARGETCRGGYPASPGLSVVIRTSAAMIAATRTCARSACARAALGSRLAKVTALRAQWAREAVRTRRCRNGVRPLHQCSPVVRPGGARSTAARWPSTGGSRGRWRASLSLATSADRRGIRAGAKSRRRRRGAGPGTHTQVPSRRR